MPIIPQLPIEWLIHEIRLETYDRGDNGKFQHFPAVLISNVRLETQNQVKYEDGKRQSSAKLIMFVDYVNSTYPNEGVFKPKSKITWRGQVFEIESTQLYDGIDKPHHFEVMLV